MIFAQLPDGRIPIPIEHTYNAKAKRLVNILRASDGFVVCWTTFDWKSKQATFPTEEGAAEFADSLKSSPAYANDHHGDFLLYAQKWEDWWETFKDIPF
jgi:hypothetical protein